MESGIQNILAPVELKKIVEGVGMAFDVPAAFLDASGKALATVGGRTICSGFPLQEMALGEKDGELSRPYINPLNDEDHSLDDSWFEFDCPGGCSAVFKPLIVDGRRLGTFFLGQYQSGDSGFKRFADIQTADSCDHQCVGGREHSPFIRRKRILEVISLASGYMRFLTRMVHQGIEMAAKEVAIEESDQNFRSLFNHTPVPLYVVDLSGRLKEANQAACEKLGLGRDDLLKLRLEDLLPSGEMGKIHDQMSRIARNGSAVFETVCARGLAIEVSCRYFESGGDKLILAQVRDIEARKQSDDALRKSEARFRSVFEQSNVAMTIVSPQGKFLQVNKRFCDFIGYSEEEIRRFWAWDISVPEDRDEVRRHFDNYLQGKEKTLHIERRYRRKDGATCWGSVSASMIHGRNGQPFYSIGVIEDITQQKKAEEAMHQALIETAAARDRIDAIIGSIKDGLIATDINDRIILMNQAAEKLLGVSFEEASQKSLERLVDSVMPAKKSNHHQDVRRREFVLEKKDPDSFYRGTSAIKFRLSPIVAKDGEKIGRIAVLRDITREREIDLMKSEFISTAAHELRTPLTSVKGFSEVLLSENHFNDVQKKEYLSYIYENSEVLEKIVNDLLDLSRVESGRIIQLEKKEGDICFILKRIASQYKKEHQKHKFETVLPDGVISLWFDKEKIFQVMENLLSNAVKFSPENSLIRITCQNFNDVIVISVSDEGLGMTQREIERIFDKFYRVDSSDTAVAGLGLGMAIVKNIIEAHLGRIWVESKPGCGTTVFFTLPLVHCLQKV